MTRGDNPEERELQECLYLSGEIKKRLAEMKPEDYVLERANNFLDRLDKGDTMALDTISAIRSDIESLIEQGKERCSDIAEQYAGWDDDQVEDYYYILYGIGFEPSEEYIRNHLPTYVAKETPKESLKEKSPREQLTEELKKLRELETKIQIKKIENSSLDGEYDRLQKIVNEQIDLLSEIKLTLHKKPIGFIIKRDSRLKTIADLISEFQIKYPNEENTDNNQNVPEVNIEKITIEASTTDEALKTESEKIQEKMDIKKRELQNLEISSISSKKSWVDEFKRIIPARGKLIKNIDDIISNSTLKKEDKLAKIKNIFDK